MGRQLSTVYWAASRPARCRFEAVSFATHSDQVKLAALSPLQHTGKADAEPVWISDDEIAETVIAIRNWNHDLCADFVRQLPVFVHVGNHHSDVGEGKLWRWG